MIPIFSLSITNNSYSFVSIHHRKCLFDSEILSNLIQVEDYLLVCVPVRVDRWMSGRAWGGAHVVGLDRRNDQEPVVVQQHGGFDTLMIVTLCLLHRCFKKAATTSFPLPCRCGRLLTQSLPKWWNMH